MRTPFVICLFSFFLIAGCNQHSATEATTVNNATDTIAYTLTSSQKVFSNTKDSASVSMTYPIFKGNSPFEKLLTNTVAMQLSMSDSIIISPEAYMDSFLGQYANFIAQNKDYTIGWYEDVDISVLTNTAIHFCIAHSRSSFTGGAHGNTFLGYTNFDRKSNRIIRLEDVIEEGTIDKLTTIAEPLFRAEQGIADSISLENAGYFVFDEKDKGKFKLNRNFILLKDGIQFFYNDYEIAPHAVGTSSVFIPYAKMEGILKKDFVL